jgi:hypothetical protein
VRKIWKHRSAFRVLVLHCVHAVVLPAVLGCEVLSCVLARRVPSCCMLPSCALLSFVQPRCVLRSCELPSRKSAAKVGSGAWGSGRGPESSQTCAHTGVIRALSTSTRRVRGNRRVCDSRCVLTCPQLVDPHRTKSLVAAVVCFEMVMFDVTVTCMTVTWNHTAPVAMRAADLSKLSYLRRSHLR